MVLLPILMLCSVTEDSSLAVAGSHFSAAFASDAFDSRSGACAARRAACPSKTKIPTAHIQKLFFIQSRRFAGRKPVELYQREQSHEKEFLDACSGNFRFAWASSSSRSASAGTRIEGVGSEGCGKMRSGHGQGRIFRDRAQHQDRRADQFDKNHLHHNLSQENKTWHRRTFVVYRL